MRRVHAQDARAARKRQPLTDKERAGSARARSREAAYKSVLTRRVRTECQYAPRRASTAGSVLARIEMSSQIDQFSM